MKKPKRPFKWEEDEEDSSERIGNESEETAFDLSRRAGMDLEGLDEDEIIDLEDIIELSEEDQEEGELGLDVELLDVEPDLDDAGDLYSTKTLTETKGDSFGDDLLKDFSLEEEESFRMDPSTRSAMSLDPVMEREELMEEGREDIPAEAGVEMESLLEDKPLEGKVEKVLPVDEALGAVPPHMERSEFLEDADFEIETGVLEDTKKGREIVSEAVSKVEELVPKQEIPSQTASIEEFVSQIEGRLIETVRGIVESKLPEVVRTILQEEIERLKKESL